MNIVMLEVLSELLGLKKISNILQGIDFDIKILVLVVAKAGGYL
jgi:hypothetical protein